MKVDFLIIGGGIIGLTIARSLLARHPQASIAVIEKENAVARHGSGRNSGVLHAGFYYTADSLKARFCRDGSRAMRRYCEENGLAVNHCKKLVVASNTEEAEGLKELKRRGDANGVEVELISEAEAERIEPNARTWGQALFSPATATVNPVQICGHMRAELAGRGVKILTGHPYSKRLGGNRVEAGGKVFDAGMIFNCAGLYADVIAQDFGFSQDYTILPFKGIYLKYKGADAPLRTNLYPVPNLKNPFLGVHFTLTVDGTLKIGPTAIPAFWRENYSGFARINIAEMAEILRWQTVLFARNAFGFRHLAYEEMLKYNRKHLIGLALKMVKHIDADSFREWSVPGIRAQLLHKKNLSLVQDFVVEGDTSSVHVLNAVSPAFTCSLPFADWVVERWAA